MRPELTIETRCLSSLIKLFPDQELNELPYLRATAFLNETFSFQLAYRAQGTPRTVRGLKVHVESPLVQAITVRTVGLVPSELPIYPDHDGQVLRTEPGLFPDPLLPIEEAEGINAPSNQWRALWITVVPDGTFEPGSYPIRIALQHETEGILAEETFHLQMLPAVLPEQSLIHTEWFHSDCLAVQYHVEVFSEEHWSLIEKYARTAVRCGINMLLTPLFTPPLDTLVGGERPTVQLVDVSKVGDSYTFGFDRLRRWIAMCDRVGIRYLEFAHLFTQWGAEHAPKIMGTENGQAVKLFGWETDAAGPEYKRFLGEFLPALVAFLKQSGEEHRCYFHISDEPHLEHLQSYRSASEALKPYLEHFPIIDALSDYEFYEHGLVQNPIPSSNRIESFLHAKVPDLWTYYCCSQYKGVSNRFFSFPSARNRILGLQLYKYDIAGFLHWGYNFWFSQYSISAIDPFQVTDARCAFPSGDPFLVYPGADGPIESIRLAVLYEALQDLRALKLLESLIGREETLQLIEEGLTEAITFDHYPQDSVWLLNLRERINRRVASWTGA